MHAKAHSFSCREEDVKVLNTFFPHIENNWETESHAEASFLWSTEGLKVLSTFSLLFLFPSELNEFYLLSQETQLMRTIKNELTQAPSLQSEKQRVLQRMEIQFQDLKSCLSSKLQEGSTNISRCFGELLSKK